MAKDTTRHDAKHTREVTNAETNSGVVGNTGNGRGTSVQDSPMMVHLLDALTAGTDIGHYGRLTFVMVARFFLPEGEIVKLLQKQPNMDETQAKALVLEVRAHDYNPPQRDQILQWQRRQSFPICPNVDDPRSCNVYDELRFPESVYHHITEYYEQQVEAHEHEQNAESGSQDAGGQPSA